MEDLDVEIEKAVSYCLAGYDLTFQRITLQGGDKEKAHKEASFVFKLGLPRPYPGPRIKIFIACVTTGIVRGVFNRREANLFLYAAQVMQQSFNERKRQNRLASRVSS